MRYWLIKKSRSTRLDVSPFFINRKNFFLLRRYFNAYGVNEQRLHEFFDCCAYYSYEDILHNIYDIISFYKLNLNTINLREIITIINNDLKDDYAFNNLPLLQRLKFINLLIKYFPSETNQIYPLLAQQKLYNQKNKVPDVVNFLNNLMNNLQKEETAEYIELLITLNTKKYLNIIKSYLTTYFLDNQYLFGLLVRSLTKLKYPKPILTEFYILHLICCKNDLNYVNKKMLQYIYKTDEALNNSTKIKNNVPEKIKNNVPEKIKNNVPEKIKNNVPEKIKNNVLKKIKNNRFFKFNKVKKLDLTNTYYHIPSNLNNHIELSNLQKFWVRKLYGIDISKKYDIVYHMRFVCEEGSALLSPLRMFVLNAKTSIIEKEHILNRSAIYNCNTNCRYFISPFSLTDTMTHLSIIIRIIKEKNSFVVASHARLQAILDIFNIPQNIKDKIIITNNINNYNISRQEKVLDLAHYIRATEPYLPLELTTNKNISNIRQFNKIKKLLHKNKLNIGSILMSILSNKARNKSYIKLNKLPILHFNNIFYFSYTPKSYNTIIVDKYLDIISDYADILQFVQYMDLFISTSSSFISIGQCIFNIPCVLINPSHMHFKTTTSTIIFLRKDQDTNCYFYIENHSVRPRYYIAPCIENDVASLNKAIEMIINECTPLKGNRSAIHNALKKLWS